MSKLKNMVLAIAIVGAIIFTVIFLLPILTFLFFLLTVGTILIGLIMFIFYALEDEMNEEE